MKISKEKVEKAMTLKQSFAKRLSELNVGENVLGGHHYFRDAEKRTTELKGFEASNEYRLFKEFLEGLAKDELQELQAIGFYGRGEHKRFASAFGEAAEMEQDARDIQYTMQFLSAGDYLEKGFEKVNQRHEV